MLLIIKYIVDTGLPFYLSGEWNTEEGLILVALKNIGQVDLESKNAQVYLLFNVY